MANLNILTLLVAYLFITFSVLGYGLLFEKLSFKNNTEKELGFTGLFGIFFLVGQILTSQAFDFLLPDQIFQ